VSQILFHIVMTKNTAIIWQLHITPSYEGSSAEPIFENEPKENLPFYFDKLISTATDRQDEFVGVQ